MNDCEKSRKWSCAAIPSMQLGGQSEGHCIMRSGEGLQRCVEPPCRTVPLPPAVNIAELCGTLSTLPSPTSILVLAVQTGCTTSKIPLNLDQVGVRLN